MRKKRFRKTTWSCGKLPAQRRRAGSAYASGLSRRTRCLRPAEYSSFLLLRLVAGRKGAIEGRLLSRNGFDPDTAAMPLHNPLADRQAHPCAWIFMARMQTLKDIEDAIEVFRGDSQPRIAHRKHPLRRLAPRVDVNARRIRAAKFDGIPQQVLEEQGHLRGIGVQLRQRVGGNQSVGLTDGAAQVVHGMVKRGLRGNRMEVAALRSDPGKLQQVGNQLLHPLRAADRMGDIFGGFLVEPASSASARLRLEMSRATCEAPVTLPEGSLSGDTVTDTSIKSPFLVRQRVSKYSTGTPMRTFS